MSELTEHTKTFADIYEISSSKYEEVAIDSLSFSVRVYNRFMGNGITTVKKLLDSTPEKLLSIKGFGKSCVDELYEFLDSLKDKSNNDKINIEYISIFKSYADSIAMGDFSFAEDIEMSEEGIALLERYKTTFEILGEEISFDCVASPEKIIPIIKFGSLSTRYKDFYDLYWLIKNGNLNNDEVVKIMEDKIFSYGINNINNMEELIDLIENILSNNKYLEKLNDRKNNWIEIDNAILRKTIVDYLKSNIVVEV